VSRKHLEEDSRVGRELEDLINSSHESLLLTESSKKAKRPRSLSLKKTENKARVLDVQNELTRNLATLPRQDGKFGKQQTISMEHFVQAMNDHKVPIMVRRCIARVYPNMSGGMEAKFASAVQICTWVFMRYGYIRKGSKDYKLNSKGEARNKYHRSRSDSKRYEDLFSRTYNSVFNPKKATKVSKDVAKIAREVQRRKAS